MSDAGDEPFKWQVAQGESVYDFVVFVPALHGRKGEHSWDMKVGCFLMLINLAMQVGLTYIVGSGVLEDSSAWRTELVGIDVEDQMEVFDKEDTVLNTNTFSLFAEAETYGRSWFEQKQPGDGEINDLIHDMNMNGQNAFLQGHIRSFDKPIIKSETQLAARKPKAGGGGRGGAAAAGGGDDGGGQIGAATLCVMEKKNATYSCLPPSVRFSQYWHLLDTNKDGVWTMEEAKKDEGQLEKKVKVKPPQLMRAIIMGLVDRGDDALWIPDTVKELKELPKPFFDYWAGDAALCAHGDVALCSSLVARGIFNKALDPAIPGKGIKNINTAMDYCNFMLKPGGGCDQSLPQIYRLYKARRAEQCGKMTFYPGGIYVSDYNPSDKMYVIGVSYNALSAFIKSETMIFRVFMFLILLIWGFALLTEMRELLKLCEFLYVFPTVEDAKDGTEVEETDDGEKITINAITKSHKYAIALMTVTRIALVIYIGIVGFVFLINDTGYMDLLMNAVALAFIIEIDELLFGAMARSGLCDALESLEPLEFETLLPTSGCAGWMLMKDFWGLVVFPILACCVIFYHCHFTVDAVIDALSCACYQTGDQCGDAHYFDQKFWDTYWTQVLPTALEKISALKGGAGL